MNKRIKKLWVAALRSGKFKRTEGVMREGKGSDVSYCCLGVLEAIRCSEQRGAFTTHKTMEKLSRRTQEWAGLDNPDLILAPKTGTLASQMNDNGKSFKYIADRIEKYL